MDDLADPVTEHLFATPAGRPQQGHVDLDDLTLRGDHQGWIGYRVKQFAAGAGRQHPFVGIDIRDGRRHGKRRAVILHNGSCGVQGQTELNRETGQPAMYLHGAFVV